MNIWFSLQISVNNFCQKGFLIRALISQTEQYLVSEKPNMAVMGFKMAGKVQKGVNLNFCALRTIKKKRCLITLLQDTW